MNTRENKKTQALDAAEMAKAMMQVATQSERVLQQFLARQVERSQGGAYEVLDPKSIGRAFATLAERLLSDPENLLRTHDQWAAYWADQNALWMQAAQRWFGDDASPVASPAPGDRRFKDDAWQEDPVFDYIKQSYLVAADHIQRAVNGVSGLDPKVAQQVSFYTRQYIDALAPSNFALTNPEVMRRTAETNGQNLLQGLTNLLDDLERGKGSLKVKMTDADRFELGENVAVTPGKVVYQNDLIQLIQYEPTTDTVYKRPLLIIPPWINKYYILDLRPKNSFVKWAVEQGHTVFVISWVNPDETLAEKTFEDYMLEGPLAALDAIEQATGERDVKAIGYCLGGTLLACTLAYMTAREDDRIKAATFFVTMVDFAEPGELGVFIDEDQLTRMETQMEHKGYFEGESMAQAFNLLRANDLIWGFVVNNYLMGKEPFPFDLLYWNSDSTRMPKVMHSFYMRNMYQRNLLCEPDRITLAGEPIDLRTIATPVYMLSTLEDHIAPWKSTYAATQIYQGPVRFVLGASGHIAGVINPPAAGKYGFWTNTDLPEAPDAWLEAAEKADGSWWLDWKKWLTRYNGKKVPARTPGDGALSIIEDAPGAYVKTRSDQ